VASPRAAGLLDREAVELATHLQGLFADLQGTPSAQHGVVRLDHALPDELPSLGLLGQSVRIQAQGNRLVQGYPLAGTRGVGMGLQRRCGEI
jgi:hypothetical protein